MVIQELIKLTARTYKISSKENWWINSKMAVSVESMAASQFLEKWGLRKRVFHLTDAACYTHNCKDAKPSTSARM